MPENLLCKSFFKVLRILKCDKIFYITTVHYIPRSLHLVQLKKSWAEKEMYKRPHVPMKKLTNRLNIVVDRKFTVFQTSHILHDIIGF